MFNPTLGWEVIEYVEAQMLEHPLRAIRRAPCC